jgi:hypothetical protein
VRLLAPTYSAVVDSWDAHVTCLGVLPQSLVHCLPVRLQTKVELAVENESGWEVLVDA